MIKKSRGDNFFYEINEEDLIVKLSDNWLEFARENGAEKSCHPNRVLNRPIWKFIEGAETRFFYEIILRNVRAGNRTVTFPFRCDAPHKRRYLEMTIYPAPDHHVGFTCRIIREEFRESVKLLEPRVSRSQEFLTICSVCKKIRYSDNSWAEAEEAVLELKLFDKKLMPQLTHGICGGCLKLWMERMDE